MGFALQENRISSRFFLLISLSWVENLSYSSSHVRNTTVHFSMIYKGMGGWGGGGGGVEARGGGGEGGEEMRN